MRNVGFQAICPVCNQADRWEKAAAEIVFGTNQVFAIEARPTAEPA
jgi:hypothetical protein